MISQPPPLPIPASILKNSAHPPQSLAPVVKRRIQFPQSRATPYLIEFIGLSTLMWACCARQVSRELPLGGGRSGSINKITGSIQDTPQRKLSLGYPHKTTPPSHKPP